MPPTAKVVPRDMAELGVTVVVDGVMEDVNGRQRNVLVTASMLVVIKVSLTVFPAKSISHELADIHFHHHYFAAWHCNIVLGLSFL